MLYRRIKPYIIACQSKSEVILSKFFFTPNEPFRSQGMQLTACCIQLPIWWILWTNVKCYANTVGGMAGIDGPPWPGDCIQSLDTTPNQPATLVV